MIKVKVEQLKKSFGSLEVLKGIDLDVKEGEIAILCTDGLSDYLTEKLLFEISKKSSGEELVNILVKYALMAGGHDNITVSAVYF